MSAGVGRSRVSVYAAVWKESVFDCCVSTMSKSRGLEVVCFQIKSLCLVSVASWH